MIKINIRKNSLYLLAYLISTGIKILIKSSIERIIKEVPTFIYLYLMVVSKIIGGLSVYYYQYSFRNKKNKKYYFGLDLIYNKEHLKIKDSEFKMALLIFFASYFDVYRFTFESKYFPNLQISAYVEENSSCIQLIASSLICAHSLGFFFKRHHKASLIIMSICLCIWTVIQITYYYNDILLFKYLIGILATWLYFIVYSFNNCVEKYLVDTNFLNPFKILAIEGIFGTILSILASLGQNPFKALKNLELDKGNLIFLIFLIILYFIITLIYNVYKIYCNVIYTPMVRSLADYIANPFLNIYYFYTFSKTEKTHNYFYYISSEILCIIIVFFGCIFNEFIILSCCGLNQQTEYAISQRATLMVNIPLVDINNSDDISIDNENESNNSSFTSKN